jgi:hypothetical protein
MTAGRLDLLTMNGGAEFTFHPPGCGESMAVNASMREALLDHGRVVAVDDVVVSTGADGGLELTVSKRAVGRRTLERAD